MVADALVYHPALAHWLKFVSTTVGRDKLLRTIQYFSRFYAWYLYRTNKPQSAIDPYNAVKKQFGTTRKLMRFGKFLEHLKAASVALDNKAPIDPVLRYLAVGRQLGYAGYLTVDAITVVDAVGYRKLESVKRLQETAYRSWFAGLAFSAAAGIYSLYQLQQRRRVLTLRRVRVLSRPRRLKSMSILVTERAAARVQLVSDFADLLIPASAIGLLNLDDGIVGIAGTVSSLIGVWSQWRKTA
ncbi:Peroxisomal biogenesis factor 11 [Penicillium chermesinum]|nr:Peroxisomal biogenesis factor 11 [Penicillium chermesinum]